MRMGVEEREKIFLRRYPTLQSGRRDDITLPWLKKSKEKNEKKKKGLTRRRGGAEKA
jgi:hypothetical protein